MDCPKCKNFSNSGCAVVPGYWQAWYEFRCQPRIQELLSPLLRSCNGFEQAEPVSLTITLTDQQWKQIRRFKPDDFIKAGTDFLEQLKVQLDPPEPDPRIEEMR